VRPQEATVSDPGASAHDAPAPAPSPRVELTVSEVRQWTFCPRVLWHRRVMPHRLRETPKMALGQEAQAAVERLERRRGARRYGLHEAARRFAVPLASARLGVRGVCDLVLDLPEADGAPRRLHPVEVKRTEGGASEHHAVQLAGYALLLEEQEGLPAGSVDRGFLLLLPADELVPVDLDAPLRAAFEQALDAIRTMLDRERFPPPTEHRAFCPQCEYVRFCGDVL
jgi:CRISPR-associated exonuclease Cas4